jgi:phosphomannomutase / phosphoglucomutase
MNPEVFREYDIRGIAEQDFDDKFVVDLGRAYATMLDRAGKRTVTVGRDCRLSSEGLFHLLLEGLMRGGISVVDIGVVPTPLLYFSVVQWGVDGGVMITGSHNAAEYNGFKLGIGPSTIYGDHIQELRRIMEQRGFTSCGARGRLTARSVLPEYGEFIRQNFHFEHSLKVVVDGGNGCGGVVAVPLMRELGLDTVGLFIDMDGRFPNHHPDPTVGANMQDLITGVRSNSAVVGIAYDGDADRIGAIDECGNIVWGDELIVLFSRAILRERPGSTIIGEVKCSERMYDDIRNHGGRPIMWKTGHSLIKSKLKEEDAALAGEMSGHMFFADRYLGFDDAIYASFRLLEIIDRESKGIGELLSDLPPSCATPEIRVDCPDKDKFRVVNELARYFREHYEVNEIDGVRVNFNEGWGLVRASNTQPALVLRFEARDARTLHQIRSVFEGKLRQQGCL